MGLAGVDPAQRSLADPQHVAAQGSRHRRQLVLETLPDAVAQAGFERGPLGRRATEAVQHLLLGGGPLAADGIGVHELIVTPGWDHG
jgi:hypothetical protein